MLACSGFVSSSCWRVQCMISLLPESEFESELGNIRLGYKTTQSLLKSGPKLAGTKSTEFRENFGETY